MKYIVRKYAVLLFILQNNNNTIADTFLSRNNKKYINKVNIFLFTLTQAVIPFFLFSLFSQKEKAFIQRIISYSLISVLKILTCIKGSQSWALHGHQIFVAFVLKNFLLFYSRSIHFISFFGILSKPNLKIYIQNLACASSYFCILGHNSFCIKIFFNKMK